MKKKTAKRKRPPARRPLAPARRKRARGTEKAAPRVAAFGSWKSPLTADVIVAGTVSLEQVVLDAADVYWLEGRPGEGGRNVIVRRAPDGKTSDVNPAPFNARTRVHEYGGGSFAVRDGNVFFANFKDQRWYRARPGQAPAPITPAVDVRHADGVITPQGLLIAVREDHSDPTRGVVNSIACIDPDHETSRVLVEGNDFYSSPRLSPDGTRLAWLAWNHPNMPWDGTELWVGNLQPDGSLTNQQRIAGGPDESIFQPEWSANGELHFVSDRTGWWNLYRWRGGQAEPICPRQAEFGRPQWLFGMPTYAFAPNGCIVCSYSERGIWKLALLDPERGRLEPIATPCTDIASVRCHAGQAVFIGGSPSESAAVIRLDLGSGADDVLRRSSSVTVKAGYLSKPEAIEFPTEEGKTAHAFYYPPRNRDHKAPQGERPPLLVRSHGGPTSATTATLRLDIQFWTSRGIGVVDVNYGGSTGYGRDYRQRLDGRWGIVDMNDCVNTARFLVERGDADGKRLAIRGGSAGGYTTLCALTFRDFFRAGASYYGVSDLEGLAKETHKFESRYLDRLVGPYPERQDLYRERSPIHFTDRLSCPVILFQGLEDKVVLPNQAEMMVEALRAKKLPVAYVPFEGEQHGFRKADNIRRALEGELYFYSRIFGFRLGQPVPPVPIENLIGASS